MKKGEALKANTTVLTIKPGGGRIMLWGCFAPSGTGALNKMNGLKKNKHYFKSLFLKPNLKPSTKKFNHNLGLQQDNDPKPKHISKLGWECPTQGFNS